MAVAKGKRPSGAKKTATKREPARKPAAKARAARKPSAAAVQNSKTFRNGVLGIGLVVLCLVILLCLVTGAKTAALTFIRNEFNGYFGALRFPVLLFLMMTGLKIAFGERFPIRTTAFVTAALLLLSIATLLQVFQKDVTGWALPQKGWKVNYKGYLRYAYDTSVIKPTGGGVVGELLGYPLGKVLDIVASALVLFFTIGALGISLIRNLRPDAGARMSDWFTQLSSDYSEWRAERQSQNESAPGAGGAKKPGTLVPLPEDLLQKPAPNGPAAKPSTWQKVVGVASRVGNFFSPVVMSEVPPEEGADEQPPRPAPQPPQIPYQIPAQINEVHSAQNRPGQKTYPRPVSARQFQPAQNNRQLYIEDIITSERYLPNNAADQPPKNQKPHIRAVPSVQNAEPEEFTVPDFLRKRMEQYESEAQEADEQAADADAMEDIHAPDIDDEPESVAALLVDEPEAADAPWETMEAEYEPGPDDDLSRPFRRRRARMDNPLDAQPKLDPAIRLDRPDWKPEESEVPPHGVSFVEETEDYRQPPFSLLLKQDKKNRPDTRLQDAEGAQKLEETLGSFGVDARVIKVVHGPAITRYELQPAPGVKVSKIVNLTDDIALNMAALGVRIEAPIPGKAAIGIEIANDEIETVHLRDVLESEESISHPSRVAVALGKDIAGKRIIADLARMPHLLIAGATGSGKSVCINTLITSIIYRTSPEEVRLIMIDPKKVELSLYNGIPHLLVPVVTDAKKASGALSWAVMEMEERYRLFAEKGVREIDSYNEHRDENTPLMPKIVVIIDELSDLMMTSPGEVEESIQRLAQLARACGIHLVIATQRPSVNVITGTIKVNIPGRIAFAVASQVDSRTILDAAGAEKLLGKGDMLYTPSSGIKPLRVQGCYVSEAEVNRVVEYVKNRNTVDYSQAVIDALNERGDDDAAEESLSSIVGDVLFQQAVEMAVESGQASISMLQRRLRVGYARAGRLVDEMSKRNIIGPADGAKPREVLISREDFERMFAK